MKRFIQLKLIIATLILTFSGAAQTDAYAKFDANGNIIGLFDLSGKSGVCTEAQRFVGTVRNVRAKRGETYSLFSFLLISNGQRRVVGFFLKNEIIPIEDIEELLSGNGKEGIAVNVCRSGSGWTARQITRH